MSIVKVLRGRRMAALAAAVAALATVTALVLSHAAPAPADDNPNNLQCFGHIGKGDPSADDPESTQVKYDFGCNGPITGYQLQPQLQVTGFDTEVFATDAASGAVVGTDSFSCNGTVPGFGVNCVGVYGNNSGKFEKVTGQFAIDQKLCDEPRVDPLLTVVYASADAKGKVTQAIAGPFDLGRPRGCKATKFSGRTRIPGTSTDTVATR